MNSKIDNTDVSYNITVTHHFPRILDLSTGSQISFVDGRRLIKHINKYLAAREVDKNEKIPSMLGAQANNTGLIGVLRANILKTKESEFYYNIALHLLEDGTALVAKIPVEQYQVNTAGKLETAYGAYATHLAIRNHDLYAMINDLSNKPKDGAEAFFGIHLGAIQVYSPYSNLKLSFNLVIRENITIKPKDHTKAIVHISTPFYNSRR